MDRETAELKNLRQEILERVRGLHGILTVSSYLTTAFLIAGFILVAFTPVTLMYWYALLAPLVFVTLTFNYQANQMTMEAVGAYLRSKEQDSGWETFYGHHKKRVQLTSFLKIMPLVIPQVIPVILLIVNAPLTESQAVLASVDTALFLLVAANFRYKLF